VKVPLLDLQAHHAPIEKEMLAAIEEVLRSQAFILGPTVKKLEDRIASYSNTAHAIGVSSGTDALLVSLMALDVGPGDEVITTAYSFFATAGVISRLGAKPIFVDIDPISYNIDPEKIVSAITPKTKVIIAVHLYGQIADMVAIQDVADRYGLKVVEDAAQAIGAENKAGKRAGELGDLGCFSFFPSKNLGALGDGGMVVTNDSTLAEKVRMLRVHGGQPKYYHSIVGGNFRLDSIQAAVVSVKLNYLDGWTGARQENAKRYTELFIKGGLVEKMGVKLPLPIYKDSGASHFHIYNQYIIRVPKRDGLRAFLKEHEIGHEVYYPVPFHLQECFQNLGYKKGDFPESEQAADETLALPIYPELTVEMQEEVVSRIGQFFIA